MCLFSYPRSCCDMPRAAARDCATRVTWRMRAPASPHLAYLLSFGTVTVIARRFWRALSQPPRNAVELRKLLTTATGGSFDQRAGMQRPILATLGLVAASAHFADFSGDGIAESYLDSSCGQHMDPYSLRFTQAVIFALDLCKHHFSPALPHGAITRLISTP